MTRQRTTPRKSRTTRSCDETNTDRRPIDQANGQTWQRRQSLALKHLSRYGFSVSPCLPSATRPLVLAVDALRLVNSRAHPQSPLDPLTTRSQPPRVGLTRRLVIVAGGVL